MKKVLKVKATKAENTQENQKVNKTKVEKSNTTESKKTKKVLKSKESENTEKPKKVIKLKKKVTPEEKVEKVIKDVAKQQAASLVEKVTSNREVKYIYPEGIEDTLQRKKWRQSVRNKLKTLERAYLRIKDENSKEYKEAKKAFEIYKSEVLKPNVEVV
jgi:hypothetical protein